jgi:broad specificity phosphatase PhoE
MDARLDETGRAQSVALGTRIREARMQVDVVLVSPMTRAVETAVHMFPPEHGVPLVAIEMCREAHGGHPCDQRRPISVIAKEFPHVNYSEIETDADEWHRPDRRCGLHVLLLSVSLESLLRRNFRFWHQVPAEMTIAGKLFVKSQYAATNFYRYCKQERSATSSSFLMAFFLKHC